MACAPWILNLPQIYEFAASADGSSQATPRIFPADILPLGTANAVGAGSVTLDLSKIPAYAGKYVPEHAGAFLDICDLSELAAEHAAAFADLSEIGDLADFD